MASKRLSEQTFIDYFPSFCKLPAAEQGYLLLIITTEQAERTTLIKRADKSRGTREALPIFPLSWLSFAHIRIACSLGIADVASIKFKLSLTTLY